MGKSNVPVCIYISYLYICTHAYIKEIYFRELARTIVRPGKSDVCKAVWQAGNSDRS